MMDTSAYHVRGYTLYQFEDEAGFSYGLYRHAPEGGVAVALPDTIRVVFDQRGQPSVQVKLQELDAIPVNPAVLLK